MPHCKPQTMWGQAIVSKLWNSVFRTLVLLVRCACWSDKVNFENYNGSLFCRLLCRAFWPMTDSRDDVRVTITSLVLGKPTAIAVTRSQASQTTAAQICKSADQVHEKSKKLFLLGRNANSWPSHHSLIRKINFKKFKTLINLRQWIEAIEELGRVWLVQWRSLVEV